MSIIKMTDWQPPNTGTFGDMQEFKQNPNGPYREILMDSTTTEAGEEVPIPYAFEALVTGYQFIRIPHALSIAALGADGQTATPAQARIPDVAIPVMVFDADNVDYQPPACLVMLAWNTDLLGLPASSTGAWADENYIYLAIVPVASAEATQVYAKFVVYVEYTHSIISNEIVTGEYYALTLT